MAIGDVRDDGGMAMGDGMSDDGGWRWVIM